MTLLPFVLSLSAPAQAQDMVENGDIVREALAVQVTDEGFAVLEQLIADLVPTLLGDGLDLGELGNQSFDVPLIGTISISGLEVDLGVQSVTLQPTVDQIELGLELAIGLNSPSNTFALDGAGCDTNGWIDPFPTTLDMTVGIELFSGKDGLKQFDVTLGEPNLEISLSGGDVNLPSDNFFEGLACGAVAGGLPLALDLLFPTLVQPAIDPLILELEPAIEDALAAARFDDSLEILDLMLDVSIQPEDVAITPNGLELVYSSMFFAEPNACFEAYDPGGFVETGAGVPGIGGLPADVQVAAHVADELVGSALHTVTTGGLLCYTVQEGDIPGIPFDASLITLLGGEGYGEILDEGSPLVVQTEPRTVPSVAFGGTNDIDARVDDLGINFYASVDGRLARVIGVGVSGDAGVNLALDDQLGTLDAEIALDLAAFDFAVVPEVLVPGTAQDIEDGLSGLVETVAGSLLGDLLAPISIPLPAVEGFGLDSLSVSNAAASDWLTVTLGLGPVTYGSEGDALAGCAGGKGKKKGGGCDLGCTNGGLAPLFWFVLPLAAIRRRR